MDWGEALTSLSIVGMACRFPDAQSPAELWENVLARRQAFRRIPEERLQLEDYFSTDREAPDSIYATQAAVIEGFDFDRVRYRVSDESFRCTDMAHWLALDVARHALADAGYPEGAGLPHESTGVIVGNTLTGEFSRANSLRLRWPYVRRVLEENAPPVPGGIPAGWMERLEQAYKSPFPETGEESLAGGLSNTLAGRIANHFDLRGGAFTVDGACAASMLAVTQAASALESGDLDVALVGGVDLSIDPFELIGFAKCGALAADEMRVFDARSNGFWPGEGCGFLVLMRGEDAAAYGRRPYASIRGWGVSSDGSGGLTRPAAHGQALALRRAYRRAGYTAGSVAYFEAHGTGTAVGDAAELAAIASARKEAPGEAPAAVVSSIKANIGHTKAAAGIAGMIKAAMALHTQVLPPVASAGRLDAQVVQKAPDLRVLASAEMWPQDLPLRAGVSAMGFGGINAHVTLEGSALPRRGAMSLHERRLAASAQDAELFLLSGDLRPQAERLRAIALRLSRSELTDLSVAMAGDAGTATARAALVASTAEDLFRCSTLLCEWLDQGIAERLSREQGVYLGSAIRRVGFLFPGQGITPNPSGGALAARFGFVTECFSRDADLSGSAGIQTGLVRTAAAALRVLRAAGIEADVALGHSLGELTALHWAGAFDEEVLFSLVRARGEAMDRHAARGGSMLALSADAGTALELLRGTTVAIAALNAPGQTVVSGTAEELQRVGRLARERGVGVTELSVSHAFHSPLMAAAAPAFQESLARVSYQALSRPAVSTVTGGLLEANAVLPELLARQFTTPVRFTEAIQRAAALADVFIEAGAGEVLTGLAAASACRPVFPTLASGPSLRPFLDALGVAFACGRAPQLGSLLQDRFARPFSLDGKPRFFVNPCEASAMDRARDIEAPPMDAVVPVDGSAWGVVRTLIARRAALPPECIDPESRLLADLHLNSIVVSELVIDAARQMGLPSVVAPLEFADATAGAIAQALDEWKATGGAEPAEDGPPAGIDSWVRTFQVELRPAPLPRAVESGRGEWKILASPSYRWKDELAQRFQNVPGRGTILCVDPHPDLSMAALMLDAAGPTGRLLVVQHGGGGAGFAKTLFQEVKGLAVVVVDAPYECGRVVEYAAAEAAHAVQFSEAVYDASGLRHTPGLKLLEPAAARGLGLCREDVLLVSGGGKGISAECALDLARSTGARVAILGRSPADDPEVEANLARFAAAGTTARYYCADIADAEAVRHAASGIEAVLGAVTALLHGAGTNTPRLLANLSEEQFRATLAPKTQGLRNIWNAIDLSKLRLCVAFGSIIAHTGMRGEGDYSTANEWLRLEVDRFGAAHPSCRCLTVEWSVWSGAGMGQRLGRVEALAAIGIRPIPIDSGVRILRELINESGHSGSIVVTGRFGETPTLPLYRELPLLRFTGTPRVHYPGVELVSDMRLSPGTDLYLEDHCFHGQLLFPAVIGLEAMAQAAFAVSGGRTPVRFENVRFLRPIPVSKDGETVRIAALARSGDEIEVAVRTGQTAFQTDHFCAVCRLDSAQTPAGRRELPVVGPGTANAAVLYESILFHRGRFRRAARFLEIHSRTCLVELAPARDGEEWFSGYLAGTFLLGDAGARDAAIHAIQACIPSSTVLPVAVDRIEMTGSLGGARYAAALEAGQDESTFTYDVDILDADGRCLEQWRGLKLQVVAAAPLPRPIPAALVAPYLERRAEALMGAGLRVEFGRGRRNGAGRSVAGSAAYSGEYKLALRAGGSVGCDLERVEARPPDKWRSLLGSERFLLAQQLAAEMGSDLHVAATRVWTAIESLKKAGFAEDTPLLFDSRTADDFVVLKAGAVSIATLASEFEGLSGIHVIALLAGEATAKVAASMVSVTVQ
jgi:enediyne polyketide synthase